MPFVLDASVAVSWGFDDEHHPTAAATLYRIQADSALVPSLWWFETRKAALMNERRGRVPGSRTTELLPMLGALNIVQDPAPDEARVLRLARLHRLMDAAAACLDLAARKMRALATLDRALARAAVAEGIALIGP